MATVTERLDTLEAAVLTFVSRTQILALINAQGTDHLSLQTQITALQSTQALILDEIQSLKDRVAALEP